MKHYRKNIVYINLSNISNNYNEIKGSLDSNTKLLAVIKANAYGHGLVETAKALHDVNVDGFCVAILEEAVELRESGIKEDVYILSNINKQSIEDAIKYNVVIPVSNIETFTTICSIAKKINRLAYVHIAINTGMNRIGFNDEKEINKLIELSKKNELVKIKLCFTHLANCDECLNDPNKLNKYTISQIEKFEMLTKDLDCPKSVANSAGILRLKNKYDYARCGIIMYGYPPVKTNLKLKKALEWHTEIINIMNVKKNEKIGYGCTYTAEKDLRIATVATGYGDGYLRAFSNKANVLIHGEYAKVVGRVCMDQIMVDITDINDVSVGEDVILIGESNNKSISAEDLADIANTISYEILLSPSSRVEKKYI